MFPFSKWHEFPNVQFTYVIVSSPSLSLLTNFSGWWFDACGPSNLNGMFYTAGTEPWKAEWNKMALFQRAQLLLRSTTMMIDLWTFEGIISVKSNYKSHQEIWRSHQMRNCLKISEANNMVSLLATSSSYVKSPRSLTVNLEPLSSQSLCLG